MEYYDVDKLNSDLSCPRDIKGLDVDLCCLGRNIASASYRPCLSKNSRI
jgi:hypothetical protein